MTTKIIWITGASTGIGRALALAFAHGGAQVIASARSALALEDLVDSQHAHPIHTEACDVTDTDSLQKAADNIQQRFGKVDTLIVNAGTCEYFDVAQPDWQMMARVMKVNYFGAINTVAAALPLLRQSTNAHIAGIASMASDVAFPKAQAYGSSKAAVRYFFESLSVDLAKENIAVTVVRPGFVKTPLTDKNDFPMPFMVTADDFAQTLVKRLPKQPLYIRYPRRLGWILSLMSCLPRLWHGFAVSKLVDSQNASTSSDKKITEPLRD